MSQIFISWSGEIGKRVASALTDWFPTVIQEVSVFMSENIDKGDFWLSAIANNLAGSSYGIICVTEDSKSSPWLHYEAGALSQRVEVRQNPKVATFLHKIEIDSVGAPLSLFQATNGSKQDDIYQLLKSINSTCANPLAAVVLEKTFERAYPELLEQLNMIPATDESLPAGELEGKEPDDAALDLARVLREILMRLSNLEDSSDDLHSSLNNFFVPSPSIDQHRNPHRSNFQHVSRKLVHRFDPHLFTADPEETLDNLTQLVKESALKLQVNVQGSDDVSIVFTVNNAREARTAKSFIAYLESELSDALIEPPDVLEYDEARA